MLAQDYIEYSTPKKYHAAQSLAKTQVPTSPWSSSPWTATASPHIQTTSFLIPPPAILPTPLAMRPIYPHCEGDLSGFLVGKENDKSSLHLQCEGTNDTNDMNSPYLMERSIHIVPRGVKEYIHCPFRQIEVCLSNFRALSQVTCVVAHGGEKTTLRLPKFEPTAAGSPATIRTTLKLHCNSLLKCFFYDAVSFQLIGQPLVVDVPKMICRRQNQVVGKVDHETIAFTTSVALISTEETPNRIEPSTLNVPQSLPPQVMDPPIPVVLPKIPETTQSLKVNKLSLGGLHENLITQEIAAEMTPTFKGSTKQYVIVAGEIVNSASGSIERETICGFEICLNHDESNVLVEGTVNSTLLIDVPETQKCVVVRFVGLHKDGQVQVKYLATIDLLLGSDTQLVPLYSVDNRMTPLFFHVALDGVDSNELESALAALTIEEGLEDENGEESSPRSAKRAERNRRRNRKRRLRRKASRANERAFCS